LTQILNRLFRQRRELIASGANHPNTYSACAFGLAAAWFRFKVARPELQVLAYYVGGLPAVISLAAGLFAWLQRRECSRFFANRIDLDRIRALSWQQFEQRVGDIFRNRRYLVDETGGGGADGGVDLRLHLDGETTVVQCKHWRVYRVGVRPVRELFGVMTAEGADRALLITSGVYTEEARRFAADKPVELIDGRQLAEMFRDVQGADQKAISVAAAATSLLSAPNANSESGNSQTCPRCGSAMVLRTARRGQNVGGQFWGCSHYPACKGTRVFDPSEVEPELRRS
jgi:restriction system protein